MPFLILPYFGSKPPEVTIEPLTVTSTGRTLDPNEAVAARISGRDWSDVFVHSRVRPFVLEGKRCDKTTLLLSTEQGRPGPAFMEEDGSWPREPGG
jgi:hypothetical protein